MTAKRILLAVTGTLAASVLALVGLAGVDNAAQAQGASLQPTNVQVVNGPNAGEAVVSWDAVAGAAYYRVGWVSVPNYLAVTGAGRDWREAFYFVDLKNAGQTSFTVSRLEPGAAHLFLVGGNSTQYGEPQWSGIQSLTLNSDTTACPAPTPTPGTTATPTPGPTTTATPPPTATGGDYDADNDGLIEIRSITQLDAIRHDLDGDGLVDSDQNDAAAYAAAFPNAATGMGCRGRCTGYELANDLDFGTAAVGFGWAPIGYYRSSSSNAGFSATFDGNGRTVSNLFINRGEANNVGLFGYVGSGGVVRGVGLRSVYVVGSGSVGGLVGSNHGAISASYATGTVSGVHSFVGGLVGDNRGTITASYATGTVSGSWRTGGLVGENGGTITASYATGTVSSGGDDVGGLVGWNTGAITASYATGTVSSSEDEVGGLVGENGGAITASYATGTVSGRYYVGGLVGNGGDAQFSFWDTETSGLTSSSGGAGKTTAELQSPTGNTGIYARWNPNWWDFGTSSQYPVLKVDGLSVALQRGETVAQGGTGAADADRAALVAFYEATGGANWTNTRDDEQKWLVDDPNSDIDDWYGVTIDRSGRVQKIILSGNNLVGRIPEELGSLSNLQTLSLSRNRLSGGIPIELSNLDNLGWLNLEHNKLTGQIPARLGNLTQLRGLGLGHNSLRGRIPAELGNLSNLKALYLDDQNYFKANPVTKPDLYSQYNNNDQVWLHGQIPETLGQLGNLEVLSLSKNRLNGPIPDELGNLSNLSRLSLGSNQLNGPIPSQLGNLARLQHLYLQENQLTGPIPSQLGSLANLNNLDLSSNRLSGGVPTALSNLAGLKLLRLSNNQLTGAIPPQLGNLSSLTRLYLYENQLSGAIPAELGRLSKLEVLDLSHNRISGEIPAALFASGATAASGFRGNGSMPAEAALATNIVYLNPDSWLSQEIRPQPSFLSSLRVLNLSHNQLSGSVPSAWSQHATLKRAYFNGNQDLAPRPGFKKTESGKDVHCTADMEAKGSVNDLDALAKLYELTDGRGIFSVGVKTKWDNHNGWEQNFKKLPTTPPLKEWYGVEVDAGRVIGLNLNDNDLQEKNGVTHWATHLINLNKNAADCTYPLYWLKSLDLGNNQLHGDIGRLLSALRLQPGATLKVDLSGANNRWNPDHVDDVDYKDITVLRSPDLSAVADELTEEDESIKVTMTEVANLGLAVLSKTAKSKVGMMIGRIGSSVGSKVGFINAVTHHEAVTAVVVGIVMGRENEELQRTFLDLIGIKSGPVRDRILHGCFSGFEWNAEKGRCVIPGSSW